MASSSGRNINSELIDQFVAVTGTERSVAVNLLEACAGNLDMAVGMHMDSGGGSNDALGGAGPSVPVPDVFSVPGGADGNKDDDDDVRAPIPQRTETLIEEGDDKAGWRLRRPKRFAHSVFDGFRNFQSETYNYEDMARGKKSSKKRNLEDLFRPPVDITVKGTFQNAKDAGSANNKWLLVNVQNVQEFPCQVLNRDVWSNLDARKVIKESFIFWQIYNDSEEGKRFMQFYKLKEWPFIAVLDPFTGESQVEWNRIPDGKVFCELAKSFLSDNPVPDTSQSPSAAKRQKREPSIVDATEDEQMEAAIRASLEQHKKTLTAEQVVIDLDSDQDVGGDSDVETFSDPEDVVVTKPQTSLSSKSSGTTKSSTSTSQSSEGSHEKSSSLRNGNHSKTSPQKRSHPKSSSSSSSSAWTCSNSNTASSSQNTNHLSRYTSNSNSDILISHRDLVEAGSSGRGGGASLPGSGASHGLDSPLHENLDLLDDLVSGRGAEVCTPDIPEVVDSSSNSQSPAHTSSTNSQDWKEYWGNASDPTSRLLLRFPDNVRDQVELPCSSSLQALVVFCTSKGFPPEKFELVTAFPRRKLSQMDTNISIKDAGLHPQETIFVQDL